MSEPCQHEDMDEDKANREMHCLTCGYTIPITKTPAAGAASRPEGVSPEGPTPDPQSRLEKALAYLETQEEQIRAHRSQADGFLHSHWDTQLDLLQQVGRILRGMP